MAKPVNQARFISLHWKSVLGLLTLAAVLLVVLGWQASLSYQRNLQEQLLIRHNYSQQLATQLLGGTDAMMAPAQHLNRVTQSLVEPTETQVYVGLLTAELLTADTSDPAPQASNQRHNTAANHANTDTVANLRMGDQSWQLHHPGFPSHLLTNVHEQLSQQGLPSPQPSQKRQAQLLPVAGGYYSLVAFPLDHRGQQYLLILADAQELVGAVQQQTRRQLAINTSLAGLLLLVIALLQYARRRELVWLIELLPLLGKSQFHQLREQLSQQSHRRRYRDERDSLNQVTTELSYQLESLENAVDIHSKEMERLSLFDPLTGLANRSLFRYELEKDLDKNFGQAELLAVAIVDLDKFKRINDNVGHQQGDQLLGKLGQRLKNATKHLGLAAHMGGDQYALILRSAKNFTQLEHICQKILELMYQPMQLGDNRLMTSCSLGVCLATPGQTTDDLIKNAELAMHNAKRAGGNTFRVFNLSMATAANATLTMENELRRALEHHEFTLYLQPKVTMQQDIEGFEALVRWDHPDRGIVPPVDFIPALESLGLIYQLDNFVLETSCRQLQVLQKHYPDISIAVNISSTHFTEKRFLSFLKRCLQKYPIDPSRLELEITETLLMENMSMGMAIIQQIKALGVSIAIDDFGTGYSSLSYLKNLPVDTIKIDREFIKDIPESESDMQISSVIIFLARQLDFKVVAEGVETKEQLKFLQTNQCDLAQGFLFSKPIPAHKAMILLESQRSAHH